MARNPVYYLCVALLVIAAWPACAAAGEALPKKPDRVAELSAKLSTPDLPEVDKVLVAGKLIDLKNSVADDAIRGALDSKNPTTVCATIAAIRDRAAVRFIDDLLEKALGAGKDPVRLRMVQALALFVADKKSGEKLTESLLTVIRDTKAAPARRVNAVAVFGALAEYKKGITIILANVKDDFDARVQQAAIAGLAKLTHVRDIEVLAEWRSWWKKNSNFEREKWVDDYNRRLEEKFKVEQDRRIKEQIIKWTEWAGNPAKRGELLKQLKEALKERSEPSKLRAAAARHLGKLPSADQSVAKLILNVMKEPELNEELLSALVFAVGSLGVTKINGDETVVTGRLIKLYQDNGTSRKVRIEIITALAKIAKVGKTKTANDTAGFVNSLLEDEKTARAGLLKEAIEAVGDVGDARAAGSLSALVLDLDNAGARILKQGVSGAIRSSVARALGKLEFGKDDSANRDQAIKCLLVLLGDMELKGVRGEAASSLAAIGVGIDAVTSGLIAAVKAETDPDVLPALTYALSRADRKGKGIEAILDALEKATADRQVKLYIVHLQQLVSPIHKGEKFNYASCLGIVKLLRKRGLGKHLQEFMRMEELQVPAKNEDEENRRECRYELGQYLLAANMFDDAVPVFVALVKLKSDKTDYLIALAEAHFGAKDYKSAYEAYKKTLKFPKLSTDQTEKCWNRILDCLGSMEPVGAKSRLEELLKKDSELKPAPEIETKLKELLERVKAAKNKSPAPPAPVKPK